jgi:DsbC/DsbD-like thiol-disulfide interchange protein/cytochrome c biogenesis protein CcdA
MFAAIMWRLFARLSTGVLAPHLRLPQLGRGGWHLFAIATAVSLFLAVAPVKADAQQSLAPPGSLTETAPRPVLPTAFHQTENVGSELISARSSVAPGERFWVALRQKIRPGWHTYWENPGDSGLPAQFAWTLPAGAASGPIQWPAPQRFRVGPLMNYGFSDQVLLLVEIGAPPSARVGERLDLQLDATWLVCAEICIPEEARLALSLPVAATGAVGDDAPAIAAARAGLPPTSPWPAAFASSGGKLLLRVDAPGLDPRAIQDAYFFARDGAVLEHAASQGLSIAADSLTLTLTPAEGRRDRPPASLDGLLSIVERTGGGDARSVFTLAAAPGIVAPPLLPPVSVGAPSLWQALIFALLGGLVLNLMPCVFPVLSMKALALAGGHAGAAVARRRDALGYALGVIASFAAIAAVILAMRGAGAELGWGFQFQSPVFVALLGYVMLAVGLNLSGVFNVSVGAMSGVGAHRDGGTGAFLTGLLAVVVATPCTAPFMGAALGVALVADAPVMLAILLALALGFAAPFVLVALSPAIAGRMPKPGPWMVRLKQLLAFPMYATAAWLLWVLSQQVDPTGFAWVLGGVVCVGFAAWLIGSGAGAPGKWPRVAGLAVLAAAIALAAQVDGAAPRTASPQAAAPEGSIGEPFTPERLAALRQEGRTVMVNMTAAWCITCLFNERGALASLSVRAAFASDSVAYLKGDWTNRDATISRYLREFGRSGVPLYVVYRPGAAPEVLPQILTEGIVLSAIGARG